MTYSLNMPDAAFEALIDAAPFAHGVSREVFKVPSDQTVIVKRMREPFPGANLFEWFIWNSVNASGLGHLFGTCLSISVSGRYLMMERLDDLVQSDLADIPKLPVWVDDRKVNALGKTGGAIKVRDYGMVRSAEFINVTLEPIAIQIDAAMKRSRGTSGW